MRRLLLAAIFLVGSFLQPAAFAKAPNPTGFWVLKNAKETLVMRFHDDQTLSGYDAVVGQGTNSVVGTWAYRPRTVTFQFALDPAGSTFSGALAMSADHRIQSGYRIEDATGKKTRFALTKAINPIGFWGAMVFADDGTLGYEKIVGWFTNFSGTWRHVSANKVVFECSNMYYGFTGAVTLNADHTALVGHYVDPDKKVTNLLMRRKKRSETPDTAADYVSVSWNAHESYAGLETGGQLIISQPTNYVSAMLPPCFVNVNPPESRSIGIIGGSGTQCCFQGCGGQPSTTSTYSGTLYLNSGTLVIIPPGVVGTNAVNTP